MSLPGGTLLSMSREPIEPGPVFTVGTERCESETVCCEAGAHVLELATAFPGLGVSVETLYVTANGAETRVTDLLMGPGEEILATRRLTDFPICGDVARLRCLRDHAVRVEAFLVSLGHDDVAYEFAPEARAHERL